MQREGDDGVAAEAAGGCEMVEQLVFEAGGIDGDGTGCYLLVGGAPVTELAGA